MNAVIAEVPDNYRQLLGRPLNAHLATVRPDGTPQVNPMWFKWDGKFLYFTHTTTRQKYRNVSHEPNVSISIADPSDALRYLEVRGVLERVDADSEGEFFMELADLYDAPFAGKPPRDANSRVILVVRPTATSRQ